MEIYTEVYLTLNKDWKATCKIVLGGEIGELSDFDKWLKEYHPNIVKKESSISGKKVTFGRPEYCKSAKFISLDEVEEKSIDPLTINEIKDIDSIVEAVSEKMEYVGDKVLGNSSHVESSDNVIDSHYVMDSANILQSSNVYSTFYAMEGSKHIFGCNWMGKSEFIVKGSGYNCRRLWESSFIDNASDAYYTFGCLSSSDIMFSFSQRNKRNMIGNLQLSKDKYLDLKKKLLGEIRHQLSKNKTFPSIYEMVRGKKHEVEITVKTKEKKEDMAPIEKSFSATTKILFKNKIDGITEHEKWLSRHFLETDEVISPFGSKTYRTDISVGECKVYPDDRIVSQEESLELSQFHLEKSEIQSIAKITERIGKIGYFAGDFSVQAKNAIKCAIAYFASNVYKNADCSSSEYCGVNMTIMECKHVFGSNRLNNSEFCINCYHSFNLKRCFEVDHCRSCSDLYFSHNCEGVHEGMFCFNTKGKRYAIGNLSIAPDEYRKHKEKILEQIVDEIKTKKELKWDIYNIGCGKK